MRRTARPYAEAVRWMVLNDDTFWADDEDGSLSVTAALVADLYGRSDEEVTADLIKARNREKATRELARV